MEDLRCLTQSRLHHRVQGACDPASVKVRIDTSKCQGHGRCYDLAPAVFTEDDEGYGEVIGDGVIAPDQQDAARLAEANCPESAIVIDQS
jgi:ferredoxin